MKYRILILSLLILTTHYSLLNSTLWEIKQDNTGDFTTITAGIEAAQDGDTLLVYPGIYYEHIQYSDKDLVITSLYRIQSDDRSIIKETIIDGNHSGRVVTVGPGGAEYAVLSGFTVRNGRDINGGGIFVQDRSSLTVKYCIIEHNHSQMGVGGVRAWTTRATVFLVGNTIRYNTGGIVGGVWIGGGRGSLFCNEEPNSIYLNYGSRSSDLIVNTSTQKEIVIDTATVKSPDHFFMAYHEPSMPQGFELIINNGMIEPIAADLYVGPDGCDSNSGLTPEEPLQRIATALIRIQPDRYERRTIHIAEGVYSPSLNNQWFPLTTREYVDLVGADKKTTIIHGNDKYVLLRKGTTSRPLPPDGEQRFTIKNLTLTNAFNGFGDGVHTFGAIWFTGVDHFTLENLIITNTTTTDAGIGRYHRLNWFQSCNEFTLRNIDINNNRIGTVRELAIKGGLISIVLMSGENDTMYGENIRIRNNHSPTHGGKIYFCGEPTKPLRYKKTFVNLEITDNSIRLKNKSTWQWLLWAGSQIRFINATISGNRISNRLNPAHIAMDGYHHLSLLSLYNSILYDSGSDYQLLFVRHPSLPGGPDIINVSHSLIENGKDNIISIHNVPFILNWGKGNIDEDPLFVGEDVNPDYPYMVAEKSPVRGAGTLDIPDFEFPEYDLAGNPRIVNGKIDMGAYQWHPPTSVEDSNKVTKGPGSVDFNLRNFPNPVTNLHSERQSGQTRSSTGTNINFTLPDNGNVMIEIYNLKGQFVKRVFDAHIPKGEHNVFWDGKDERGRYVATGFYMYNLHFNERLVATGKATFIK